MAKKHKKGSIDLNLLVKKDEIYYVPDGSCLFTGLYHWEYPSGIIAEEGQMRDGRMQGQVRLYSEEGVLLVDAEYVNGNKSGLVTTYYPSGHLKSVFNLLNGKREGKMRIWYENGGKKLEAFYKEDKLSGKQIKYFGNGQVNVEMEYLDDKEQGLKTVYKEDGTVLFKGIFDDGELV